MPKKSSQTGTQKKAGKQVAKAVDKQARFAQKQIPQEYKNRKSAQHSNKQISKGRHIPEYEGKTKYEPFDYKAKTKYEPSNFKQKTNYEHSTLGKLQKDFARAGKGLEPLFEQRKQAALADFNQNLAPEVTGQYGQGTAGSSALFQAQNAAKANLQRNLSADFEGMRNTIAQNLLGQRAQEKQFGATFGAGQEQYYDRLKAQQEQYASQFGSQQEQFGADIRNNQNQFSAQFGMNHEQNLYNSQLQGLQARLNANQALMGNPVSTQFSNLQSPYNSQHTSNKQPTFGERYVNSIKGGAVGAGTGFLVGGPVGAGVGAGVGGLQGFMG